MPRMKLDDSDFNVSKLDVEYDADQPSDFPRYSGDIAPTGTVLNGRLTKMWWTFTKDGDSMIKLVCVAEGNDDDPDTEEYEGLSSWDNITFKPDAAFKYQPFLEYFGITLKDIKFKLMVASDDDPRNGTPITAIAWFEPGSDDALCRYTVSRDRWNGKWNSKIDRFLPLEDDEGEEPEEEARPARTRKPAAAKPARAKPAAANGRRRAKAEPEPEDEYDEDEDDYEEEEPEEEPERPARRARTTAKAANSRPATKTRTAARSSGTRSGGTAQSRAKARGRQAEADGGYDDEPPF